MKLHNLKILPEYYLLVMNCDKTFELRKNDRNYKKGDYIHFVKPSGEEYPGGAQNLFVVTYVLSGVPQYGLQEDFVILSIKKLF